MYMLQANPLRIYIKTQSRQTYVNVMKHGFVFLVRLVWHVNITGHADKHKNGGPI